MNRTLKITLITLVSAGLLFGAGYFLTRKFLGDRFSVLYARPNLSSPRQTVTSSHAQPSRTGTKLPAPIAPIPGVNPAVQANEAAVQRSLRTVEEINRINQQNQRLMEQQQRMQNQK